jgi:Trk K+ transport system NAD-binding subunit
VSTLVFHLFADLDPIDAIYFTVTIITTTGFGDINLRDSSPALKLYAVLLMLLGAAALAVFYALIADAIVGARLARALGGPPRRMHDHIVVCGLGNIGYRIVDELARRGIPVVAVEIQESGRFLPAARRLGVPVIAADARLIQTLQTLNLAEARCLIAATADDVANLETALNARALNPDLRAALRLFDPDLAARVERAFGVHISRSVSALAAPAFAAAAVGQHVISTVPVGVGVLVLARTRDEAGSQAEGHPIAILEDGTETRVLVLTSGDQPTWRPPWDTVLAAGQELTIIATRRGYAQAIASLGGLPRRTAGPTLPVT